jgi:SPX domain protein involved in polyphosphate accumulation
VRAENRFIVPPHLSVVEIKVNERVPYWLTELVARHNVNLIRVSKYVQSVEAFGRAPRSIFHLAESELSDMDLTDDPLESDLSVARSSH